MRILLLNQTFLPDRAATAQQLADLARHLVREGHEVIAVAARRSYEDPSLVHPPEETVEGIRILRVGSTGFGKRSFFHRAIDAFTFLLGLGWRLVRLKPPDVVVSFTSPPLVGVLGWGFARLWRAKSVQWLMDINPHIAIAVGYLRADSRLSRFLHRLLGISLRRSDAVIVLDDWMKKTAVAAGARPGTVFVIPPWPAQNFHASEPGTPRENAFRREHGLSGKFVILYSGNHSIVHPLDTLLGAAYELREDPQVAFVFIGDGLRRREVEDFKERHGLSNIRLLPYQPRDRLSESLACPDMHVVVLGEAVNGLVHPSKVYGVLAAGRPYLFIGPEDSFAGHLLRQCPYGFGVEHGDTDGVLQAIARVRAMDEPELSRYEENNLRFVRENYLSQKSISLFSEKVLSFLFPCRLTEGNRNVSVAPRRTG